MAEQETGAGADLGSRFDEHRSSLLVHCYRFLGSYADAEEATQEAYLRAWRGRDSFRGDASVKTWLHRIATRVCLDQLRRRSSRSAPGHIGSSANPGEPPAAPTGEISWLEPIPTTELGDASVDPESAYTLAESVKLAFVAALQTLPPKQRAVLLLRDVLGWSAAETGVALETSVPAVNSALHRAREQLRQTYHGSGIDSFPGAEPQDPRVARMLATYVQAWQRDDVDGLVETLRADVRLAMPPIPSWYDGRDDVVAALRDWVFPMARFRLAPASFNAQPAYITWQRREDGSEGVAGVQVLAVDAGGIFSIDSFLDPSLAGLPRTESR
jgi:RNA polymerase sigma-70 factor (ECF subfamily)